MKTVLIFLVICGLFACNNETSFEKKKEEVVTNTIQTEGNFVEKIVEEEVNIEKMKSLIFNFDNFSLLIDDFDRIDEMDDLVYNQIGFDLVSTSIKEIRILATTT